MIIPVYNVEEFLPECLNSVVNQSFADIEIVIINDQSPDQSQVIIDDYASKDSRIVSIIHPRNKGLGGARNTGINAATGQYIFFLDSDDWLANNTFEILAKEVDQQQSDIIKFGYVQSFGDTEIKSPGLIQKNYTDGWQEIIDARKKHIYTPICSRSVYKRTFLLKNQLYFPEKLLFEDFSFSFKANVLATKISSVNDYFYFWRREREGSITYAVSKRDVEVCQTLKIISDFIEENNFTQIANSSEFNYLMYEWSAGTTLYKYLKSKDKRDLKNQVMEEIVSNKYFVKFLNKILKDKNISMIKKVPVFLLKNNFWAFRNLYSIFFFIRKTISK